MLENDDSAASRSRRRSRRPANATRGWSTTESAAADGSHIQVGMCAEVPSGCRTTNTRRTRCAPQGVDPRPELREVAPVKSDHSEEPQHRPAQCVAPEIHGLERAFPEVGPANVKGIELDPYAAELARVSVWIGEIQWMRRNGFAEARDPILKPLDTIECPDAIVTADNTEPEWPAADVVVGNSPFLGGKLLITHLGDDYVSRMFSTYAGRVPAEADLVCY